MRKDINALIKVKEIFDKHKIKFWLEHGTLLGAVRDGKLVEWDNDIDVGTWVKDIRKIAKTSSDFRNVGLDLSTMQGHYLIRDSKTNQAYIDIYSETIKNDFLVKIHYYIPFRHFIWILSSPDCIQKQYSGFGYDEKFIPFIIRKIMLDFSASIKTIKRHVILDLVWKYIVKKQLYRIEKHLSPKECIDTFDEVEMYGKKFSIPGNPIIYLDYLYGDWKVPRHKGKLVTEWNGKKIKLNKKNEVNPVWCKK